MQPVLEVKDLSVGPADRPVPVLAQVSFTVGERQTVVVIGSNGAGKTMLLKTLVGLIPPRAGTYRWRPGVRIGYVPQKFALDRNLPLTVAEFLSLKGNGRDIIHMAGLEERHLDRPVGMLSGGQLQRVAIAWALLGNPDVLVFDEPTESIDLPTQASIYEVIDGLKRERGVGIFLATHDLDVIAKYADMVLCLQKGKVVIEGREKHVLHHHGR